MVDVKQGLREVKEDDIKSDDFWGKLVSIMSILNGMYILYHTGTLSDRLDFYMLGLDENIFGWLLVLLGISKFIGHVIHNRHTRAVSIIGLTIVWGILFLVSILWSFGIGYPSNNFLINGMVLATCLRIAHKGIFNRYGMD